MIKLTKHPHIVVVASIEQDENDEFVGTVNEIEDIVVDGETPDEVLSAIAENLMEYAKEHLTDSFRLYFNAPNRRQHFPFVLKVAMQNSLDDVKRLINA